MALNLQPTLVGPTLTLRPLTAADHGALRDAADDPLIWEQHPARDRHEEGPFTRFFNEALVSGGALIVQAKDGAVIGTSRYDRYDRQTSSIEIGWTFLTRAHWGGPANREVKTLMLDHAFTDVDRVWFSIAPDNVRSQRAVLKLGAHRIQPRTPGNHAYELTRHDWQARKVSP